MSNNILQPETKPWLSNRTYDALKWVTQIFLPAFGALYFGLSQIWGLPAGEEVVGTIAIVTVFLGTILKLSASSYNNSEQKFDGALRVQTGEDVDRYVFDVSVPLEDLRDKNEITLKVARDD